MLKLGGNQVAPFAASGEARFVTTLADELRGRFPERYGFAEDEPLLAFVRGRIAFARDRGITRENLVAALVRTEAATGLDFTAAREGEWAYEILASDQEPESRVNQLVAGARALEVDPGFVRSEHERP